LFQNSYNFPVGLFFKECLPVPRKTTKFHSINITLFKSQNGAANPSRQNHADLFGEVPFVAKN
jgi:hypothetical protein